MGEIHIFCPIPLKGNKSKCRRLGKKHKNGILEGEKVSIGSKAGVEETKYTGQQPEVPPEGVQPFTRETPREGGQAVHQLHGRRGADQADRPP